MNDKSIEILERIHSLRTFRQGERRAPHKPLLILFAIAQLQRGNRSLPFESVKEALDPLLMAYAPPVKRRHQPELPYWHLMTDGLWIVDNADQLQRQASGFPTSAALRSSSAGFPTEIAGQLENDEQLVNSIVRQILFEHFPESTHDEIMNAVGLSFASDFVAEKPAEYSVSRRRDPNFRGNILRAYEFRCAFSGFRAALNGSFHGCEAAHVRWHAYDGPDDVSNGLALEPTIHALFDIGAWSLTNDHRIIVSSHLTGTDETVERIRGRHGQPLRSPIPGEPNLNPSYIEWHREPDLGGVFRTPGLSL